MQTHTHTPPEKKYSLIFRTTVKVERAKLEENISGVASFHCGVVQCYLMISEGGVFWSI